MRTETTEAYLGQDALTSYLKKKSSKSSYRGFLNLHRDVVVSSSISKNWSDLDNIWAGRFLREAGKLDITLGKKVERERAGDGLKSYWKEILFNNNNKENQPVSTEHRKRRITKECKTTPKKRQRKWMVDDAITQEERLMVYFVDPVDRNVPLVELIRSGEFVVLQGPRSSGKTTRALEIQDQLQNEFVCIYVCFEQVNMESVGEFWQTFGIHLYHNTSEYNELDNINSASDFRIAFQKNKWNYQVVLLIDEFDRLYRANEDVKSTCLETIRDIKATKDDYAIWSIVAIGPFSIIHLESNNLTTSPFVINDAISQGPNFTLEQVQSIYKQFADEYRLIIDQEVINDIYMQTNGCAGLVCLCGRVIFRKLFSKLNKDMHISFDIWKRFSMSLGEEIIEYQTLIRMKNALLVDDVDVRNAMNLLRSNFIANIDPIPVVEDQKDLALFLTAEGVLVHGENADTFKISSPLMRWLVLRRIFPQVFPSCPKVNVPYHSNPRRLDILEILKQAIQTFDKETMNLAPFRSFKEAHVKVNNDKSVSVPRESVYDAELYRILSNWLIGFTITGQWHLIRCINDRNHHKYSDIVISSSKNPTVVLELLATAKQGELDEHFGRALSYAKLLLAGETWVVHFTCEDNATDNPYWPVDRELKKGLRVVHIWHDLDFAKIGIVACWWDFNNHTKYVTDIEEFMISQ